MGESSLWRIKVEAVLVEGDSGSAWDKESRQKTLGNSWAQFGTEFDRVGELARMCGTNRSGGLFEIDASATAGGAFALSSPRC